MKKEAEKRAVIFIAYINNHINKSVTLTYHLFDSD